MFRARQAILSILIFILSNWGSYCFSQEEGSPQEIELAIEKAIKNVYKDKARQEEALIADLEEKLKGAVREWIAREKSQRDPEMLKLIDQKWELLSKFGPRIHYNYYLRGYDYVENESDIIKTNSLLVPYKGYLKVTEILYVQREHPSAASDVSQFFYTASTPIKISFDYKKDGFVFVNAERGELSLNQGWPEEMLKRIKF